MYKEVNGFKQIDKLVDHFRGTIRDPLMAPSSHCFTPGGAMGLPTYLEPRGRMEVGGG